VNVVEDALLAAIAAHDDASVLRWLLKLSDAGHLLSCPPFRVLSVGRLAEVFPDCEKVMEMIKEPTRVPTVLWHVEASDVPGSPVRDSVKLKQFGLVKKIFIEEKFGFISDSEGRDWFFHSNFLLNQKQWDTFGEGTKVGFAVGTNSKGPCAVDVYRA